MEITDWEITYSYSSYLLEPLDGHVALLDLAVDMVTSGLCAVAYHSSDLVFSRTEDGGARMSSVAFDWGADGERNILRLPEGLDSFETKCVVEGGRKSYHEKILLSDFVYYEAPYVRGFCEPLVMEVGGEEIVLYPQLKVYSNGVVLLMFRRSLRDDGISTEDFVKQDLNLATRGTGQIQVPPGLLRLQTQHTVFHRTNPLLDLGNDEYVDLEKSTIRERASLLEIKRRTEETIRAHTEVSEIDGFSIALAPIDPVGALLNPELDLQTLRSYYMEALESVVDSIPGNLRFLLSGPQLKTHTLGRYWSGRPKVFIHNFEERPSDASDIEDEFRSEIASILARSPAGTDQVLDDSVLTSKRPFDDYALFVSEGVDLWVYTDKIFDLEGHEDDDAYEMLTLSHQIQGEFIEYIHMSYRRLEEVSTAESTDYSNLQRERERMVGLDRLTLKPSQYGELNELFEAAMSQLQIPELRSSVKDGFSLRSEVLKDQRETRFRQFGSAIAVIFGLLGATGLAIEVILPLLRNKSWASSIGNAGIRLLSFGISVVIVFALVLGVLFWTRDEY